MNYYDIFQRMCMMRKIPEDDLCRYLEQLLGINANIHLSHF